MSCVYGLTCALCLYEFIAQMLSVLLPLGGRRTGEKFWSDRARIPRRGRPRRTLIRGCTACEIITTPLGWAAGCRLPCHPRDTGAAASLFWPTLASPATSCHATRLETRDLSGCAGRHGRPAARRRIEQGAHCATDRWRIGHGTHPTCDPPWMQRATMRTSMETGSTSSR